MACGYLFVAGLVNVNLTVSPSTTRTTGPGIWPSKVHAAYFSPLPSMTISVSTAVMDTSWVLAKATVDVIVASPVASTRPRNEWVVNIILSSLKLIARTVSQPDIGIIRDRLEDTRRRD